MPAVTSATVYAVTPIAGVDVGAKSSSITAPGIMKPLTPALGSNGRTLMAIRAAEALGSIETVKISATGMASSDAGSGGYTLNAPGGLTANQYGWAMKTAI